MVVGAAAPFGSPSFSLISVHLALRHERRLMCGYLLTCDTRSGCGDRSERLLLRLKAFKHTKLKCATNILSVVNSWAKKIPPKRDFWWAVVTDMLFASCVDTAPGQ